MYSCNSLGVTPRVGELSLAALISALLFISTSCRPTSFSFTKLEINHNLHLIPTRIVSGEPTLGSYYFFFHTATGMDTVDHFQKKSGEGMRERLLYLETDPNQVLDRTVKLGTLYAEKTCHFARPVASGFSYISVHSYFNQLDHEIPSELSRPPESLPPLTSVSLVRIFRADPEYLVVSANYEPNGELGSLHIDGAKGGDWLHSNFVPAAQDGFVQRIPKDRGSDALKSMVSLPTLIFRGTSAPTGCHFSRLRYRRK